MLAHHSANILPDSLINLFGLFLSMDATGLEFFFGECFVEGVCSEFRQASAVID